jgi:hypothetical protein
VVDQYTHNLEFEGSNPATVGIGEENIYNLVKLSPPNVLFQAQAFCLKHMVASLPDLSMVYDAQGLAEILMKMLTSIPHSHLV